MARPWLAPLLLATLVVVAYAPSLPFGYLHYDDDWLIESNPVMHDASAAAPYAILFDLSRETRLVLGAEYLPVRDLVTWSLVRVLGTNAQTLRVAMLGLYVAAMFAWRAWFRRMLGPGLAAELAALAFALHPIHAESVAWLAGMKDVLALLFSGLALAAYTSCPAGARRAIVVTLCVAAGCFSKAASVVVPGLLLLSDAWRGARPDRAALSASFVVAGLAAALHAGIGARVGMYATMPGGDRVSAIATMAPVAVRYALRVVLVEPASIVYDVPDRDWTDPIALVSLALLGASFIACLVLFRRGEKRPLLLLGMACVALAPVSQVFAPIQHRMADRYLFVALAAPAIACGLALARVQNERARWALSAGLALVLASSTALRAMTLASPADLWIETSERAPASPVGPYQLGATLERSRPDVAEAAYREALVRDAMTTDTGRRAADNLAILLASSARVPEATELLERAHERYPHDPHVGNNLAVLLDARGEHERARAMLLEVMRESPRYPQARISYSARWGEPPVPTPEVPRYDAGERAL